jgi:phosphocarrier protein HPr
MSALCETVEIANERGLHARASAKFVNMVSALPAGVRVVVRKDAVEAAGGSILGLMMLGAAIGDSIEITVSGDGASEAMAGLVELVRGRFGESA